MSVGLKVNQEIGLFGRKKSYTIFLFFKDTSLWIIESVPSDMGQFFSYLYISFYVGVTAFLFCKT